MLINNDSPNTMYTSTIERMDSRNWRICYAKLSILILSTVYIFTMAFTVLVEQAEFNYSLPAVWMKYEQGVENRFEWTRYSFLLFTFTGLLLVGWSCLATLASCLPLVVYSFAVHVLFAFIHFWVFVIAIDLNRIVTWCFVALHTAIALAAAWLWLLLLRSNQLKLQRTLAEERLNKQKCHQSRPETLAVCKSFSKQFVEEIELPAFDIDETTDKRNLEQMIRRERKT